MLIVLDFDLEFPSRNLKDENVTLTGDFVLLLLLDEGDLNLCQKSGF